jgi:hypothetical protein
MSVAGSATGGYSSCCARGASGRAKPNLPTLSRGRPDGAQAAGSAARRGNAGGRSWSWADKVSRIVPRRQKPLRLNVYGIARRLTYPLRVSMGSVTAPFWLNLLATSNACWALTVWRTPIKVEAERWPFSESAIAWRGVYDEEMPSLRE